MIRIAKSNAKKDSDKIFIVDIMKAFTSHATLFAADVFPVRGFIEDVRFENTIDPVGMLDDGSEVDFKRNTTNPRDTIMGLTVVGGEQTNNDISYLFKR
jgi:hypothetical protein